MINRRLRVLLVPDSTYWVTGTIAKSIARFNPWIEATIASGPVIDTVFTEQPELMQNFDLVHFICPYASQEWLPRFRNLAPCVTSHHHVTDWNLIKHNVDGDAIIVGSPEWSEDLRERGVNMAKVFCVPYGVDADKFKPPSQAGRSSIRKKLGISQTATVVGFFGKNSSNDDDRKGIDVFAQGILDLQQSLPELAVLIIGPGWKEMVNRLADAEVRCIWIPYVEDLEDLAELYHALDVYWVTARIEGGPVTLLEAMSSKVCCLTTPVGLAREIVRDGNNAVLLPFNDAQSFVERTMSLSNDPTERERIGGNARETILKNMHVGITSRRVEDVYAAAFATFMARNPPAVRVDVHKIAEDATSVPPGNELEPVPLNGFPVEIHRRVRMLEALAWSEHLILYHQQRALAFKMIAKEWLRNPRSAQPWRVSLRRFLPASLVGRVVKLKNRHHGPVSSSRIKEHSPVGTRYL
jgi:glycosyltransferase involved in cell wall biosynthesis